MQLTNSLNYWDVTVSFLIDVCHRGTCGELNILLLGTKEVMVITCNLF